MTALRIEIVSDVVCPWCFLGTRRLEQALALPPAVDATVTYRPFLLDPSTPVSGADLRARLQAKFGDPEVMFLRVEAAAHASGIPLDFAKVQRYPSTVAAHTLLRHALPRGTQRALADALFTAYFLDGRDIGEVETLAAIATFHGFTAREASAVCGDESELAATRAEAARMTTRGIAGVPFTIVGGRVAVAGAQPIATYRRAIEKALGRPPAP